MMMLALRRASAVAGLTAAAACVQHRKTSECFFWRKAAEPSPTLSSRDFVLAPYGVLGERLTRDRRLVAMAPEPRDGVALVDPAGLDCIQLFGPSAAGAASGAIYYFLGIHREWSFPADVVEAVHAPGLAKHHAYTLADGATAHCIHTVGPNFNEPSDNGEDTREDAVARLAAAYVAVLTEFDSIGAETLRLLPISGGVFAGPWQGEIAALTRDAIDAACAALPEPVAERLGAEGCRLELCIFAEDEWEEFVGMGFAEPSS